MVPPINRKRTFQQLCTSPKSTQSKQNRAWFDEEDSFFSNISLTNSCNPSKHAEKDTLLSCLDLNGTVESASEFQTASSTDNTKNDKEDCLEPCKNVAENPEAAKGLEESPCKNTQWYINDLINLPLPSFSEGNSIMQNLEYTNFLQGSQYETREEIKNRAFQNRSSDPANLGENSPSPRWESHVFPDDFDEQFPVRGDFYGLPDGVRDMIFQHKSIRNLYEWQDECLNLPAIRRRKNLVYALPTSGGKTLVAEILMLREIVCREKNVLFILPYVSLVQEKVSSMAPFALALDFLIDEYTAGKGRCPPPQRKKRRTLFVASIEKGAILFDSLIDTGRANEISLVVVDELHLIGEKGRGATLESLLTKIMYIKADIQIIGMSATIGNLPDISNFLDADIYTRGFRPVELKEYIKCGPDILEIDTSGRSLEEIFIYRRTVDFNYSLSVAQSDPDHLAGLVSEVAPRHSCLVFCPSKRNCENVALLLTKILPKTKFHSFRRTEKAELLDAFSKVCGIISPPLEQTIPYGVAFHHSGLTSEERKLLELAYRKGTISVICCTSTLAAGVNLPAKRVIIRAPYVGKEFLSLCRYKQMSGRAGRAGFGEAGESFLICSRKDNNRVGEMLFSPMDKVMSVLEHNDGIGLQNLILSSVGLGLTDSFHEVLELVKKTLMSLQDEKSTRDLVRATIRQMFKSRILKLNKGRTNIDDNASVFIRLQDIDTASEGSASSAQQIVLSRSTRFELTPMGKAAFKAGIDFKKANLVCKEIERALKTFILSNYSHILYLVVSFAGGPSGEDLCAADPRTLFYKYVRLDPDTNHLFRLLDITEAHMARLARSLTIYGPFETKFTRLYKVMMLQEILNGVPIPIVSTNYSVERGSLQTLVNQSLMSANALVRLCEQIEEFWSCKPLFERVYKKLDLCGRVELEPLMELPSVKINRARQLYAAGFRSVEDVAKSEPTQLANSVQYLSLKTAREIISAAKMLLMKKLENLEEETEAILQCLKANNNKF